MIDPETPEEIIEAAWTEIQTEARESEPSDWSPEKAARDLVRQALEQDGVE